MSQICHRITEIILENELFARRTTAEFALVPKVFAEGYSYQDAAEKFQVSIHTIRNYIRSIYEKLHVHSKSEAVSKAIRYCLIS